MNIHPLFLMQELSGLVIGQLNVIGTLEAIKNYTVMPFKEDIMFIMLMARCLLLIASDDARYSPWPIDFISAIAKRRMRGHMSDDRLNNLRSMEEYFMKDYVVYSIVEYMNTITTDSVKVDYTDESQQKTVIEIEKERAEREAIITKQDIIEDEQQYIDMIFSGKKPKDVSSVWPRKTLRDVPKTKEPPPQKKPASEDTISASLIDLMSQKKKSRLIDFISDIYVYQQNDGWKFHVCDPKLCTHTVSDDVTYTCDISGRGYPCYSAFSGYYSESGGKIANVNTRTNSANLGSNPSSEYNSSISNTITNMNNIFDVNYDVSDHLISGENIDQNHHEYKRWNNFILNLHSILKLVYHEHIHMNSIYELLTDLYMILNMSETSKAGIVELINKNVVGSMLEPNIPDKKNQKFYSVRKKDTSVVTKLKKTKSNNGKNYTTHKLSYDSIIETDNTGCNMLIKVMKDLQEIQSCNYDLRITNTRYNPHYITYLDFLLEDSLVDVATNDSTPEQIFSKVKIGHNLSSDISFFKEASLILKKLTPGMVRIHTELKSKIVIECIKKYKTLEAEKAYHLENSTLINIVSLKKRGLLSFNYKDYSLVLDDFLSVPESVLIIGFIHRLWKLCLVGTERQTIKSVKNNAKVFCIGVLYIMENGYYRDGRVVIQKNPRFVKGFLLRHTRFTSYNIRRTLYKTGKRLVVKCLEELLSTRSVTKIQQDLGMKEV